MPLRMLAPSRASIATRLIGWFLAIALVPCIVITLITGLLSRSALETTVRQRLESMARAKTEQIETYVAERRGDARISGSAPSVINAVTELGALIRDGKKDTPEFAAGEGRARDVLARMIETYAYENAYLLSIDGALLVSFKTGLDPGASIDAGPLRETQFADVFRRCKFLMQATMSDFQVYPGRREPAAFVGGPVVSEGRLVGVILFEFGNSALFRVATENEGLGETGETVIAMRTGDELTFVAPTKFDPSAGFRRKIRFGSDEGIDLQEAVRGGRGYGETMDYRRIPVVAAWAYLPSLRWGMAIEQDTAEAFALITRQRQVAAGLVGFTILAVGLVALVVARSITRPIREAALVAEQIASGDLTAIVSGDAPGESGMLLRSVRKMTLDLRSLIGRIQKSSITLMSTATEIAATSRQQGEAISDYGASTSEAAAAVKQISATSRELLKTMDEVNEVAARTAGMASEGRGSLGEMGRSMRQLAESTGSIGSKLSVISERAANINLAVTTIAKVADQTNLLSINAAIEAEKAGEYGLGFLVVAREIRRLADQTAVATLDIERMVKEMQYSVSAGVMEMDKFSDQVRQGVGEVAQIGDQLGEIINSVQGLTGRFDQVHEGMRVQSQGADQIREAVTRLSEGAHQTSISLREFNKATDHLREAVGGLKDEVSRFTIGHPDASAAG
ncbi:methyl-accepting chemotaxis protein (plasmid) [Tundrisphaera sp. TA3]|uniref:methyl-accepting chemotaxis protein n=1 Tax=Tundrisphaera sp. TA3 TaxID=3435775 RepID=UPI003EC0D0F1